MKSEVCATVSRVQETLPYTGKAPSRQLVSSRPSGRIPSRHLIFIVVSLLLFAPGCGRVAANGNQLKVGFVTDKGGKGDQSFNDSAIAGLERAKALGVRVAVMESKDEADYEDNLVTLADAGYQLIIAAGVAQKDPVTKVALQYPKLHFAIVDGQIENVPNVRALRFHEEQGSFLAGALAGLMTRSNKVGFIGGMPIPLIEKFQAGYEAGARTTNPTVQTIVEYTGKWDDPGKGKDLANAQISQGVDVIYHASGACGKGVIEAVKDKGNGYWAIGVDSDQDALAPGRVLTTMIKHVDNAAYDTVKDEVNGRFTSGDKLYGVAENGVSLSPMKYTRDKIPPAYLKTVDRLKQMIARGQIDVPDSLEKLKAFKPPHP